jgi:hypoxanthine-DNA glycosylase
MQVQCFSPIADPDARILILGSMPGTASLEANRYYAHPRNAFWPIMGELFGAGPTYIYDKRLEILKANKIALWDVLGACFRKGSLDSDIDPKTISPNDFETFFKMHPFIKHVFFNGSKAEEIFRKRVVHTLNLKSLHYQKLPSTSPAHASLSFEQKLAIWGELIKDAMDM